MTGEKVGMWKINFNFARIVRTFFELEVWAYGVSIDDDGHQWLPNHSESGLLAVFFVWVSELSGLGVFWQNSEKNEIEIIESQFDFEIALS